MTRDAKVVIENGIPMAEIIREEACQSCRACRFGQQERLLVDLPGDREYHAGEIVHIELPDGDFSRGVLLAYVLPLAAMLAGLFIASSFGNEGIQALGAFLGLGVGLAIVRIISKIRKSALPSPCVKASDKKHF